MSLLEAARDLRRSIDANAAAAGDAARTLPAATVEAMSRAGLYGALAPPELGGAGLSLADGIDVIAEVARADGSAGWCLMASAVTASFLGAYLDDDFVAGMFAGGVPRVAGGSNYCSAVREPGGLRVSGRWSFGSGIAHASWVGVPVLDPDDPQQIVMCTLPAGSVEILGNWDVAGLCATGSFDYAAADVRVPDGGTFALLAPQRRRGGPAFELGVLAVTAAGHAGWAVGVVRRALDELAALARRKQRLGAATTLAGSERFLVALGTLEGRARSAAAWVRESFARAEEAAGRTGKADPGLVHGLRQATAHATQDGADVVREAYLLAGTTALRAGPLARCFRDAHAGSQHYITGTIPALELGQQLVDEAPESALDAP